MEILKRNFKEYLKSTNTQIQVVTVKHEEFTKQLEVNLDSMADKIGLLVPPLEFEDRSPNIST